MTILKRFFDLYLHASIHVALSVYCLIRVTELMLNMEPNCYMQGFGFFGTIVGYNFVKYDALARTGKPDKSKRLKAIILVSIVSAAASLYCFLNLSRQTQVFSGVVLLVTALYTLPFFPNRKNARSWAGLKIYMVAACWVGVTVVLPFLNSGNVWTADFYIVGVKRFILIVVLLFIFEIIDLAWDDPHLKTVPQQIGVKHTKQLGILLLLIFLMLELFQINEDILRFLASLFLIVITGIFLVFANEHRSKYYTSFWAEAVPIFWWILLLAFSKLF